MQREGRSESFRRTVLWVLVSGACYYLATQIAWALCFPDSKVSLFFPPHAILVSVLLLVPTRHWWAYTLVAMGFHLLATQQAHWPFLYSLHCEAFDAVQNVSVAAGLRLFIKSPLRLITLRDAIVFVLIAVVIVPFGTAFWGAAFTVSNHFGTHYWVEWRNLGTSNAVTAIVLVPAILLGVHHLSARRTRARPARLLEAGLLGAGILIVGAFVFDNRPAGPDTSPALLYAPIPLLIWAALRFGLGGVSASMVVVTFQAVWGTMHGHGPFLMQSPAENALALQLFLLVTATPLMFLAVVIERERRSQSELRTSQERITMAAEAAQLGMWLWDAPHNRFWLSEKCRELFGFPVDGDVTHEAFLQRIHPDDRADAENAVRRVHQEMVPYHSEYRLLLPDGTLRYAASGRMDFDSTNKPLRMLGICIDVSERRKAEHDAREVSSKLITAQEDERKRIARDLHDDLNQRLALLSVEMELLGQGADGDRDLSQQRIEEIGRRVKELSSEVHKLSHQLHPAKLDQLGLISAARSFCRDLSQQSGLPVAFVHDDVPRDLRSDVALCFYRVIQESLQNVVKHSRANAARVELRMDAQLLRLTVSDDGQGFDLDHAARHGGLGLVGMKERTRLVQGNIVLRSAPNQGTRIELTAPLSLNRPASAQ